MFLNFVSTKILWTHLVVFRPSCSMKNYFLFISCFTVFQLIRPSHNFSFTTSSGQLRPQALLTKLSNLPLLSHFAHHQSPITPGAQTPYHTNQSSLQSFHVHPFLLQNKPRHPLSHSRFFIFGSLSAFIGQILSSPFFQFLCTLWWSPNNHIRTFSAFRILSLTFCYH